MRILHCLSRSTLGGGPAVVFALLKEIKRRYPSAELVVALPAGGTFVERFRALEIPVHEVGFDEISLRTARESRKLLEKIRPQIIHSHGKGAGLYSRGIVVSSSPIRIHSYHGVHLPRQAALRRMMIQWERLFLRRTTRVVAVSKSESADIRETFQIQPEQIRTIENVVDCREVKAEAARPLHDSAKNFLKRNRKSFVVTMIARNDPVKNFSLAISAARQILSGSSAISFVFLGSGLETPGLRDLHLDYPDRLLVLPESDEAKAVLAHSDCLMLTSRKEGRPLIVLEAWCLGKPVIATRVPGLQDLVQDGKTGILCRESAEDLSRAVKQLATEPSQWKTMSAKALQAGAAMNIKDWVDQYMTVYHEALGEFSHS